MRDRGYRPGEHLVVDDITGFTIRSSDAVKQWNGLLVHKRHAESRNEQDFVRGLKDDPAVKNARPPPPATFIGPRTTTVSTDTAAGATTIPVASSAGFSAADKVAVMLDNRDRHLGTISSVPGATSIVLTAALPWAASAGKQIINQTNVVAPTIG